MNIIKRFKNSIKYKSYATKGVIVKNSASVDKKTLFEGNNYVGNESILVNTKVGYSSYVGSQCTLINASIGKYCSIAKGFNVIIGQHPTCHFISTSPMFYSNKHILPKKYVSEILFDEFRFTKNHNSLEIGNDVWIGENVSVMEGVTIHDGAIVGAHSLVTKDLEPYGVYAGIPAKKIKDRFSKETIEKLIKIKWWDKEEKWIEDNIDLFTDADAFLHEVYHE